MNRSTVGVAALLAVPALGLWLTCAGSGFERSIPAEPGGRLHASLVLGSGLAFDKGSMQISSHDENEVYVAVETSGWGGYAVDVEIDESSEGVRVDGKVEGALHFLFGGPTVDIAIRVPRTYHVDSYISGGPLVLEDLHGEIVARGGGGHTGTIQQVDIRVERTEGNIRIESEGGPIQVEDVRGSLAVQSEKGAVRVSGVQGPLRIRTRDAPIEVEYAEGPMQLQSSGGSIQVDRVLGNVRAATDEGTIELDDLTGTVEVITSSGQIEISDLAGAVEARSTMGDIEVEFREAPRGLIESDWGSIQVEIPGDARFDLDAHSAIGQIQLDSGFDFVSTAETPAVSSGPRPAALGQEIVERVAVHVERAKQLALEHSRQHGWDSEAFERWAGPDERSRNRASGRERDSESDALDWTGGSERWDELADDADLPNAADNSADQLVRAGLEGLGRLLADIGRHEVGEVNGGGETLTLGTRTGSIQIRER